MNDEKELRTSIASHLLGREDAWEIGDNLAPFLLEHYDIRPKGHINAELVLGVISSSPSNFRLTESLAHDFDTSYETMGKILDRLWHEGKVRHPVGWERHIYYKGRNESTWWRVTADGYTWGERLRKVFAFVSMRSISDGMSGEP
ncbi:hypothetical protein MHEL_00620 [Mycolicibacterium helvum]|uniref:Uncharacterized protein n=2 Tax=Mycolicibacterium helvum TaxID=1534349 RepID=A0A7I7T038_9MYCO|nr:hypothetical protein MHEL_00620 [Mycolicibacterium helvum]